MCDNSRCKCMPVSGSIPVCMWFWNGIFEVVRSMFLSTHLYHPRHVPAETELFLRLKHPMILGTLKLSRRLFLIDDLTSLTSFLKISLKKFPKPLALFLAGFFALCAMGRKRAYKNQFISFSDCTISEEYATQ